MTQGVLSLGDDLYGLEYLQRTDRGHTPKTTTCATCNKVIKQDDALHDATGEHFCDRDCFGNYPYHE